LYLNQAKKTRKKLLLTVCKN